MKHQVIAEIERRRRIIEAYSKNYRKHLEQGELAKASEDLWGIVNNLAVKDQELPQLLHAAERLHANYYHNFMDQELFREDQEKTEKLIHKLQELIEQELRKQTQT